MRSSIKGKLYFFLFLFAKKIQYTTCGVFLEEICIHST